MQMNTLYDCYCIQNLQIYIVSPLLIFMLYSGVEFGMAEGVLGGHREKKCNACIYIYPIMFIIQEKHVYIS